MKVDNQMHRPVINHASALRAPIGFIARALSASGGGTRSSSRLFRKYAALLFALVASSLIANAAIQMVYAWRESRAALSAVHREKAQGAAAIIEQFLREIEGQVGWTTHASALSGPSAIDQRRFDFLRLLRQAPAVTELTHIDAEGREQLKVSRLAMDVTGSGADFSADPRFIAAKAQRRHVSAVYFRKESEPYLTLSIAAQGRTAGVTIAEVNLKFIWDVVSRIQVGKAGVAYVVDQSGLLIAHPDIGLVLRKTDLSGLTHVAAARARLKDASAPLPETARDRNNQDVLTASAPIRSLGWLVMVDQPLAEALTPVRETFNRSLLVLLGGLGLAVLGGLWIARRMAVPINALAAGAERIGAGDLDHRINVKTGDEVERLGQAFNDMGARLKESYAGLERKVDERTKELAESLEYQTAIADVLSVISRSPGQVQPVLDLIAATAKRLCEARSALIWRPAGDVLELTAHTSLASPERAAFLRSHPIKLDGAMLVSRAFIERRTFHLPDVMSEPDLARLEINRTGQQRSALCVPLLRRGEAVGVISLTRQVVSPFTPRQIALLETFADQAVIAIENARLFEAEQTRTKELQAKTNELTESLEYQTATSDVLGVIARSPAGCSPCSTPSSRRHVVSATPSIRPCCCARATASSSRPIPATSRCARNGPSTTAASSPCAPSSTSARPCARSRQRRRRVSRAARRTRAASAIAPRSACRSSSAARSRCADPAPQGGSPLHREADRPRRDLRRPGRHRHRERAPVRSRADAHQGADREPRIPDGDQRSARRHLALAERAAAGSGCRCRECRKSLYGGRCVRLPVGR